MFTTLRREVFILAAAVACAAALGVLAVAGENMAKLPPLAAGEAKPPLAAGENNRAQPPLSAAEIEKLAGTDQIALLEKSLDYFRAGQHKDYTTLFTKQERLRGQLGKEQVIDVKFLASPFSVVMSWRANAPGADRMIYVDGKWDNQMLVHPTGVLSIIGTAKIKPDGSQAMKDTLHPVTQFGFERSLEAILDRYRQARDAGDLKQESGGYGTVDGRKTILLVRLLPGDKYAEAKTITHLDMEYLVPVQIDGWDKNGKLLFHYVYTKINFNAGLKPSDFTPQANGMKEP